MTLRRNDRAADDVLNRLAGVATATSNRRLTGDPQSTGAHAIDGDATTAWTTPFSNAVGSTLQVPLNPEVSTSSLKMTQPVDERHSTITRVIVTIGSQTAAVDVPPPDQSGTSTLTFAAASGASMSLTIDSIEPRTTVDRRYGETTVLPAAINEISAPSILGPQPAVPADACRSDLVQVDGQPLAVSVDQAALSALLSGQAVDVDPCDSTKLHLAAGVHRLTTAPGLDTGLDVDRVVLDQRGTVDTSAAPVQAAPTVVVHRTRTTRTATVSNCPAGCWLILGEGFNDRLGGPRRVDQPRRSPTDLRRLQWLVVAPFGVARHCHDEVGSAEDHVDRYGSGRTRRSVLCRGLILIDRKQTEVAVAEAPVTQWPPQHCGPPASGRCGRRTCARWPTSPSLPNTPSLLPSSEPASCSFDGR